MDFLSQLLSLPATPVQMTGMGVAIGVGVSGFWTHMTKRLKQPIVEAEASRIRDESALLAVQRHNEIASMLRKELEEQLETIKSSSQRTIENLESRINGLESVIRSQRDQIASLESRNQTLESDNRALNERYQQLLDRINLG
ncbi:hypothetical protein [Endozoicomonas lisbonensis]|uniref:FtsZ-binding cell division protein ZapB n=1 Tax=Endozoicomonas lisbonensis TaxID=3120522 RepID=A0ABV2SP27_9GAMM